VELLPYVDQVLVMTVNPGFGGQSLIPSAVDKIRQLSEIRKERGYDFLINVDGGINAETASSVRDAGADAMVSGSAFFNAADKAAFVSALRGEKSV
jgi:ribulose-phosphate 3-epimerase